MPEPIGKQHHFRVDVTFLSLTGISTVMDGPRHLNKKFHHQHPKKKNIATTKHNESDIFVRAYASLSANPHNSLCQSKALPPSSFNNYCVARWDPVLDGSISEATTSMSFTKSIGVLLVQDERMSKESSQSHVIPNHENYNPQTAPSRLANETAFEYFPKHVHINVGLSQHEETIHLGVSNFVVTGVEVENQVLDLLVKPVAPVKNDLLGPFSSRLGDIGRSKDASHHRSNSRRDLNHPGASPSRRDQSKTLKSLFKLHQNRSQKPLTFTHDLHTYSLAPNSILRIYITIKRVSAESLRALYETSDSYQEHNHQRSKTNSSDSNSTNNTSNIDDHTNADEENNQDDHDNVREILHVNKNKINNDEENLEDWNIVKFDPPKHLLQHKLHVGYKACGVEEVILPESELKDDKIQRKDSRKRVKVKKLSLQKPNKLMEYWQDKSSYKNGTIVLNEKDDNDKNDRNDYDEDNDVVYPHGDDDDVKKGNDHEDHMNKEESSLKKNDNVNLGHSNSDRSNPPKHLVQNKLQPEPDAEVSATEEALMRKIEREEERAQQRKLRRAHRLKEWWQEVDHQAQHEWLVLEQGEGEVRLPDLQQQKVHHQVGSQNRVEVEDQKLKEDDKAKTLQKQRQNQCNIEQNHHKRDQGEGGIPSVEVKSSLYNFVIIDVFD